MENSIANIVKTFKNLKDYPLDVTTEEAEQAAQVAQLYRDLANYAAFIYQNAQRKEKAFQALANQLNI